MAQELLTAKGDNKPIGINWTQKFLIRHPEIKTAYVPPLNKATVIHTPPRSPPGSPPKSPIYSPDALAYLFDSHKKPPHQTPSKPANQKPRKQAKQQAKKQAKKPTRMIVTLHIRVTTGELEAKRLRGHQEQGTTDALQGGQSGRGMRLRKPVRIG